jgi:hypothetical protein
MVDFKLPKLQVTQIRNTKVHYLDRAKEYDFDPILVEQPPLVLGEIDCATLLSCTITKLFATEPA